MFGTKYYAASARFINESEFVGEELTRRRIYLHVPFKVRESGSGRFDAWDGEGSDLPIGLIVSRLAHALRELEAAYWELTNEPYHFEKALHQLACKKHFGEPIGELAVRQFRNAVQRIWEDEQDLDKSR